MLSKKLKTDEKQLKLLGFKKEGIDNYINVEFEAKGWSVQYIEELKGYYIAQCFQPSSFIPCEFVFDIFKFSQLINVPLTYSDENALKNQVKISNLTEEQCFDIIQIVSDKWLCESPDCISHIIRSETTDRIEIFWANTSAKVDITKFESVDFSIKNSDESWTSQSVENYVEIVKYLISVGYNCL